MSAERKRVSESESSTSSMRSMVRKRAEQSRAGSGGKYNLPEGVQFFSPSKGTMKIDILPYKVSAGNHPVVKPGNLWYQRTVFVHYGIGAEEKSYICLKTVNKKCPICEYKATLEKDKEGNEDLIKSLKPKERELFNVIDLESKEKTVQLWDMSYYLFGKKLEEEIREGAEDLGSFAELKGGSTLTIRFNEEVIGTNKFLEASRIDFSKRKEYDSSILDKVVDLDKALNILSHEELEKKLLQVDDEEEEDVAEEIVEEKPKRKAEVKEEIIKEKEEATSAKRRERKKAEDVISCPVEGGKYGEDTDSFDECISCSIWEGCIDKKEGK